MPAPIAAVMIHVAAWEAGFDWYRRAFPAAIVRELPALGYSYLELDGVAIELVQADEKVAAGPAGSVVYWWVDDFKAVLAHLIGLGAQLYRGPMAIEAERVMCQVRDPFGNLIGLRGKLQAE